MKSLIAVLAAAFLLIPAAAALGRDLRSLDRVPDDPSLPLVHPIDVTAPQGPAHLLPPGAKPRIPSFLKFTHRPGQIHAADHWGNQAVKEEQFRDEHGHVLTLATDNANVDLATYASLLASTYHYGEIEYLHMFVTSGANLTQICGADAAACYAADNPGRSPGGVMIVSYEDSDVVHGVIHEYGHHVDNNTYNLGGLSDCGINGDGSRRWFFARQVADNILDHLSCDPNPGWGQLLPEVFAEDYAQMVGIPEAEYHPAIRVGPPTSAQKKALRRDLDSPFVPRARRVSGRSSASGVARFSFRSTIPVFLAARSKRGVRSVRVQGCNYSNFANVFAGTCKVVVKTKTPRARFSFRLAIF